MWKKTCLRLHGPLRLRVGCRALPIDGTAVAPMLPANHLYHDPPKLRRQLDQDGYLFIKNIIPRGSVQAAYNDIAAQLEANKWSSDAEGEAQAALNGFVNGVPGGRYTETREQPSGAGPSSTAARRASNINGDAGELFRTVPAPLPVPEAGFSLTPSVARAAYGTSVMAAVRQVFGGGTELVNYHSLELAPPGEMHGFSCPAVFMNRGTKLTLTAWVPLHDMTLSTGGIVCVRGSNSALEFSKVRHTYGQHEVEGGDVRGDGCLSHDPLELLAIGNHACPLATASFEPGDLVLTTSYTLQSYLVNMSRQWRVSVTSRWVMQGDDVGQDPRFVGPNPARLSNWEAMCNDTKRYPVSMDEAKARWGIAVPGFSSAAAAAPSA